MELEGKPRGEERLSVNIFPIHYLAKDAQLHPGFFVKIKILFLMLI